MHTVPLAPAPVKLNGIESPRNLLLAKTVSQPKVARSLGDDPSRTSFGDSSAPQRALRIERVGQGLAWNAGL